MADVGEVRGEPVTHAETSQIAPITRVPPPMSQDRPSFLDYVFASRHQPACHMIIDWRLAVADHAVISFQVATENRVLKKQSPAWHFDSRELVVSVVDRLSAMMEPGFDSLLLAVQLLQSSTQSKRSAKQRKSDRLPFASKNLLRQASQASDPADRKAYRDAAWATMKAHILTLQNEELSTRVKRGFAIFKPTKLKRIKTVITASGRLTRPDEFLPVVGRFFEDKWRARCLHGMENLNGLVYRLQGKRGQFQSQEVMDTITDLKQKKHFGPDGTCVAAWAFIATANPSAFVSMINEVVGDAQWWRQQAVHGRILGKATTSPELKDIRAILPVGCVLTVLDILISKRLDRWTEYHLPTPSGCFVGGKKGSQIHDVAHGIALCLERGRDHKDQCGASQGDIEAFFDSVSPVLVARFLLGRGVESSLVAGMLFFSLLTKVVLRTGEAQYTLKARTKGSLTGTRIASSMAKIIIADCLLKCHASGQVHFLSAAPPLSFCVWVDNIYAVADTAHRAVCNLELIETILEADWHLKIKSSSKLFTASGGRRSVPEQLRSFKFADPFIVLGIKVSSSGSCEKDVSEAIHSAHRRFFMGPCSKKSARLPLQIRLLDFQRCVWPAICWRSSWWQFSKTLAKQIDSVQFQFIATLQRLPPKKNEPLADCFRRRAREAARIANRSRWSEMVAVRCVSWNGHISRNHVKSWPGFLLQWRGEGWLQQVRASAGSASIFGGILRLRSGRGRPRTRWHEGVAYAKSIATEHCIEEAKMIPRRPAPQMLSPRMFQLRSITASWLG